MSSCRTRLETVAVGVIKRHNPSSAWSPQPTPCPLSNTLFAIIASHWGPVRANDVMNRIVTSRSTPRKAATATVIWPALAAESSEEIMRGVKSPEFTPTAPPLHVPKRQASLSIRMSPLQPPQYPEQQDGSEVYDPARKFWTELRRVSSGKRPIKFVSNMKRVNMPTTIPSSADSSLRMTNPLPHMTSGPGPSAGASGGTVERQRQLFDEMTRHNERSLGPDSLRSMVPSPLGCLDGHEESRWASDSVGKNSAHGSRGSRKDGRWGFGNWW